MSVEVGGVGRIIGRIAVAIGAASLAVSLVAMGFSVCAFAPTTTEMLARATSNDDLSPFTKSELVTAALATRDYTAGSHDEAALYATLLEINRSAAADGRGGDGSLVAALDNEGHSASLPFDLDATKQAAALADEAYVLTPDAVEHLDDVFDVVSMAAAVLIAALVITLTCIVITSSMVGMRLLGFMLAAAGVIVIAAFAVLGLWVLVDFNGFFAALHSLFFAEGTWTFSSDSLLICMYPASFWMGMGAMWFATTVALSALSLIVGIALRRRANASLAP